MRGLNDWALGIELLVEELYKRKRVLSESKVNLTTLQGQPTSVEFSNKAQMIKLLVSLERLNDCCDTSMANISKIANSKQ